MFNQLKKKALGLQCEAQLNNKNDCSVILSTKNGFTYTMRFKFLNFVDSLSVPYKSGVEVWTCKNNEEPKLMIIQEVKPCQSLAQALSEVRKTMPGGKGSRQLKLAVDEAIMACKKSPLNVQNKNLSAIIQNTKRSQR